MCYFIDGIFTSFWESHCSVFKQRDSISKHSGLILRNNAIACHFFWQDIQLMKTTVTVNTSFKEFYDRKFNHINDNESLTLMHTSLTSMIFLEIKQEFNKHFTQQFKGKSLLHVIASELKFSQIACQRSLNMPIAHCNIRSHFDDR